jgi:hypothetical protein
VVDTLPGAEPQAPYKYAQGTGHALHRQAARLSRAMVIAITRSQHIPSLHFHNMPTFNIAPRTSDAVSYLQVDPFNGVAYVTFENGYEYEYTNVSRRAIMNLLINPNMSLGFWVNKNCVNTKRTSYLQLA